VALAVAYPLALVAVTVTLRFVGEAWWVSIIGLYLPPVAFAFPLPPIALALLLLGKRRLLGLQAFSALVVLFPLMGFVLSRPSAADRDKPTMRVLSFNVNSGRGGVQAVMDEIDQYSPDVVALQEIHGSSREALDRLLRERYPWVAMAGQFATATRYAPSRSTEPPGTPSAAITPSTPFQRVALETPLGPIVLYNVHTTSPRGPLYALRGRGGLAREIVSGRVFLAAGAPQIQSNADLRVSEVRMFSEAAARESDGVVLAGDTNLPPLSPVLHRFLSGYEDGFSTAGWGFGYTFPTDKWRPWMRIDRIRAKGRLRFVRFQVGRARVSDHLCVVADVQPL
jgi:vancomycin resistance protein VanJ